MIRSTLLMHDITYSVRARRSNLDVVSNNSIFIPLLSYFINYFVTTLQGYDTAPQYVVIGEHKSSTGETIKMSSEA